MPDATLPPQLTAAQVETVLVGCELQWIWLSGFKWKHGKHYLVKAVRRNSYGNLEFHISTDDEAGWQWTDRYGFAFPVNDRAPTTKLLDDILNGL